MGDPITDAILVVAENVPADQVLLGAAAVETAPGWSPDAAERLTQASPALAYRRNTELLARTWQTLPAMPGIALAAALRAAAAAVTASRAVNRVSLVWTGPPTRAVGLRSTRAVVHTLVEGANDSLVLVSFAGYRVADLVAALGRAIRRGVDVSLVLETHDDSRGGLTVDAAAAFVDLRGNARFYKWPIEARRTFFADSARLHAKCIIADGASALITSANLTSAGINDNIELGTLIEAGPLPALLHNHIELLIDDGTLELMG